MFSLIQYPSCSTCRKAAKWLQANNLSVQSRDIVTDNPTIEELTEWVRLSKLPVTKFFNTSGVRYKELNVKELIKTSTEEELIALLATEGKLVKRPILTDGREVLVGFKEEEWNDKLKK